jgi:class 3 adenylate cyclase
VNEAARLCDVAKTLPERVAASGAALERGGRDEAERWTVTGTQRLRGRRADTEIAVPVPGPGPDDDLDGAGSDAHDVSDSARSGVTRR